MDRFTNSYDCPCGAHWHETADSMCDDRCPDCNTSCSPTDSEENDDWSASDDDYIAAAREQYATDDLEIDDAPATSQADQGCWVAAWVWVADDSL